MTEALRFPPGSTPLTRNRMLNRSDMVTCLALGLSFFALNLTLTFIFEKYYLLDYGALFQADPDKWVPALAHGNGVPTLRHPLFMLVIHPLLLGLGALVAAISPAGWDAGVVREVLVILIAPLFSGLKAAAFFALFRVMFLPYLGSLLMSLVGMLSFSQLVFGSVPDHMGISGALLTILFLQGALAVRDIRFDKMWIWTFLGIAITGVTVSNVVAFAIVYACVRLVRMDSLRSIIVRTGRITAVIIAVSALSVFSFSPLFEYTGSYPSFEKTRQFIHASPGVVMMNAERFPLNLSYTIVAPTPDVHQSRFFQQIGSQFATVFSIRDHKVTLISLLLSGTALISVLGGLFYWWRSRGDIRILSVAAALILLFNWALHSVWGTGWFYYSQHWHAALIVILAGWLWVNLAYRKIANCVLAVVLCICVIQNAMVVNFILVTLAVLIGAS